jgi:signal transduction histidine kinase/PAS domain-containing protein
MSLAANSQLSNLLSNNLQSIHNNTNGSLSSLGAEMVYTQDGTGRYLTFYWQLSDALGITPEMIFGDFCESNILAPIDKATYQQKLQQVLTNLIPERYQCWFGYRQDFFELELIISPILPEFGAKATTVLVMGRLLTKSNNVYSTKVNATSVEIDDRGKQHRKAINQITKNLRRTLDIDVIWQQTVDNLGKELELERCIICPYQPGNPSVKVIAEYHQENLNSLLGLDISIDSEPGFLKAITDKEPIIVEKPQYPQLANHKILIVPTCYQDQPNSLVIVTLSETFFPIGLEELEVAKEVADQLGTAIAHAILYKDLEIARQLAEDATRRKSEFLANVSHEIRTPLNGMIGFLKLILDGMVDDPEEQEQFLQEAHHSSLHLLEVINDILDFARIEADRMELDLASIRLEELFSDIENFMGLQANHRNLSFEMLLPSTSDDILVYGDYLRLKQVMINLVGNAIKFTHEGGITISVDVVKKKINFKDQEFPGMVKVRVADTGIGVSLDKQDKLFQLFSQVDGSRTRQYGGTGLGLAISQKLIEAMGGEVHFYSMGEGLGSTVTFTIPLYQQPIMGSSPDSDSLD